MSIMVEALRKLADAIEERERLQKWVGSLNSSEIEGTDWQVSIEWTFGRANAGYSSTQSAIQKIVNRKMPELIKEAIADAELTVEALRGCVSNVIPVNDATVKALLDIKAITNSHGPDRPSAQWMVDEAHRIASKAVEELQNGDHS